MNPNRLLLVDDAPDFGAFVRRVSERLGFETEVTANPRDFMTAYERLDPTVIVLDMVMPESDGIELLMWLRSVGSKARVLLISGFDPRYAEWAARIGSVADAAPIQRLKKPISVADLEAALTG